MPSINDINIAINSLFLDITDPITINLNKANLLNQYQNLYFRFTSNYDFEFNLNPIFRFDDSMARDTFLQHEKQLAKNYQEFEHTNEIEELLSENADTVDTFFLNYTIEFNGNETIIYFNTNSLIFKYEVIG